MALSEQARARAREVAAALPPLSDRQRDELARLIQPWVADRRRARREKASDGGSAVA